MLSFFLIFHFLVFLFRLQMFAIDMGQIYSHKLEQVLEQQKSGQAEEFLLHSIFLRGSFNTFYELSTMLIGMKVNY